MSNKKLAVIMDPIQDIKPHKDSSLAMLLVAQKRGYEIFCGDLIDVIGDYMTELNVTSPTGIRELERETGLPVVEKLFDSISSHCQTIRKTSARLVV
jgi:glutathione synthase/RimK-type ligase-like ATP-grasp enzyme